jgi:hypothetical protein
MLGHWVVDGIDIWNCGDWMGNCTAVAEDDTGQLHMLKVGRAQ